MKISKWTVALAAAGVVSFGSVVQADEAAHQVLTAISSTTLSGYVSTSAIWNPGTGRNTAFTTGGGVAGPIGGSYTGGAKQDGFNLDVVNLTISKGLDEGEWSAGYKAEMIAGPDANTFFGGFGTEQVGLKQAYVELRAPLGNGLDFKLGVWDTPIGYEVFNVGENPNYTRSYGYGLEPTSYTGVLASYKFSDLLSAQVGAANEGNAIQSGSVNSRSLHSGGALAGTPNEASKTFIAALTLTAPESFGFLKGSTFTAAAVDASPTGAANTSRVINYYAGGTLNTPLDGLTLGASFDYVGTTAQKVAPLNGSTYANSGAAYISYKASDKLKFNTRVEYYSATSAAGFLPPGVRVGPTRIGALTETIDYSLWANVITRLELRWDHDLSNLSDNAFTGVGIGTAAGALKERNDYMVALNLIYKF